MLRSGGGTSKHKSAVKYVGTDITGSCIFVEESAFTLNCVEWRV